MPHEPEIGCITGNQRPTEVDSPHVDPSARKKHGQGIWRRAAPEKSGSKIPSIAMDHEDSLVAVLGGPILFLHHPMHTYAVIRIISGRDHPAVFIDVVDYVLARDLFDAFGGQGRSNQKDDPDECRRDECYEIIMCVPVHIFLSVLAAD